MEVVIISVMLGGLLGWIGGREWHKREVVRMFRDRV